MSKSKFSFYLKPGCVFGSVCEDYPSMAGYVPRDASIVHNTPFEIAVTKIIIGNESQLSHLKRKAMSSLTSETEHSTTGISNESLF